jgi:hypothetical protein
VQDSTYDKVRHPAQTAAQVPCICCCYFYHQQHYYAGALAFSNGPFVCPSKASLESLCVTLLHMPFLHAFALTAAAAAAATLQALRPFTRLSKPSLEALRYRAEDVARTITKGAVREARARELQRELLNSEKLADYFQEHEAERVRQAERSCADVALMLVVDLLVVFCDSNVW